MIKLYISLLSEFFVLSDMAVMRSAESIVTPPLLPGDSNALTTAYYLMKLLGEIVDTTGEITNVDIGNEVSTGLKNLLESTRWKFEDVLIHAWTRGSSVNLVMRVVVVVVVVVSNRCLSRCSYFLLS